jgi:hypothetical protein
MNTLSVGIAQPQSTSCLLPVEGRALLLRDEMRAIERRCGELRVVARRLSAQTDFQ